MDYSIDAVARLTGISAFTLRNWEKRYEFLKPKRLDNGFRAYGEEHIELLRKVATLLRHGARIGDLAESIRKGKPLPDLAVPEFHPDVEATAKELYTALLGFDLRRAEEIHAQLEEQFEPARMLDLVYAPLLAQLGRDWNAGEASLAQEHFTSAFVRLRLAPYLTAPRLEPGDPAKKAICATTSGELHEGGLMLLSAHLRIRGWTTYYLGSNLPIDDVHLASQRIRPSLVCLSFTDKHGIESELKSLSRFDCTVCIGGFGAVTFDNEESLPSHLHLFKTGGHSAADVIESIAARSRGPAQA
jgi:DNA-binding transcriptional MerR regulator